MFPTLVTSPVTQDVPADTPLHTLKSTFPTKGFPEGSPSQQDAQRGAGIRLHWGKLITIPAPPPGTPPRRHSPWQGVGRAQGSGLQPLPACGVAPSRGQGPAHARTAGLVVEEVSPASPGGEPVEVLTSKQGQATCIKRLSLAQLGSKNLLPELSGILAVVLRLCRRPDPCGPMKMQHRHTLSWRRDLGEPRGLLGTWVSAVRLGSCRVIQLNLL